MTAGTLALQNAVYYAYFAPYSYERHQDLIAKVICNKRVKLHILGETLDGHDIDFLQIGDSLTLQTLVSCTLCAPITVMLSMHSL